MTRQRDLAAVRFKAAFPDLRDAETVTVEELRRCDDALWNSFLADDALQSDIFIGSLAHCHAALRAPRRSTSGGGEVSRISCRSTGIADLWN